MDCIKEERKGKKKVNLFFKPVNQFLSMAKSKKHEMEGIAFVGFMFIGFALSALVGRWDIFPFLGLGLGFVAMLVVMMLNRE